MNTINSIAPWFGGKRTLAPTIVEALGPHRAYWEPFCGSMAVLLAKPSCQVEIVNDLHSDLINLARVIRDEITGPKLYRRLRRVLASEEEFRDARQRIVDTDPSADEYMPQINRAFDYFVMSWLGMNGFAGTTQTNLNFARRFSTLGGSSGIRWTSAVQSIPQWRKRLERVQVLHSDAIELCEKIEDREGTVIYCDPPYLEKGAKYLHDFADADHQRLADALNRFRSTRVVVSYYDHPSLDDLYPRFFKRSVALTKGIVNAGKRGEGGRVEAPEVILSNLPWPNAGRETQSLFGD